MAMVSCNSRSCIHNLNMCCMMITVHIDSAGGCTDKEVEEDFALYNLFVHQTDNNSFIDTELEPIPESKARDILKEIEWDWDYAFLSYDPLGANRYKTINRSEVE